MINWKFSILLIFILNSVSSFAFWRNPNNRITPDDFLARFRAAEVKETNPWDLNFQVTDPQIPENIRQKFSNSTQIKRMGSQELRSFVSVLIDDVELRTYDVWIQPIVFYGTHGKHGEGCNVNMAQLVWVGSCLTDLRDIVDGIPGPDSLKRCKITKWELSPVFSLALENYHISYLGCNMANSDIAQYVTSSHKDLAEDFMPKNFQNIINQFKFQTQEQILGQ